MMWDVIPILAVLLMIWIGWVYGVHVVTPKPKQPQADTVDMELARWREKYAHDEISLLALEKTVARILETNGEYRRPLQ